MTVQRFKPVASAAISLSEQGEYVKYEDYAALADRLAETNLRNTELVAKIEPMDRRIAELEQKNDLVAGGIASAMELQQRAVTAERRIAELENDCWIYESTVKRLLERAESVEAACIEACRILDSGERMALTRAINILLAAGIGKGE